MRIKELVDGMYATRKWYSRGRNNGKILCIGRIDGALAYFEDGKLSSMVRPGSSSYNHSDFVICNVFGEPLNSINEDKGSKMLVKIIVVCDTTSKVHKMGDVALRCFEKEEDALDFIQDVLECDGRAKFTMFKPYQVVEVPRPSLKEFIKPIEAIETLKDD